MFKKVTFFLLLSLIVVFSFAQPIIQGKELGIPDPISNKKNPILETKQRAGSALLAVNDSLLMSKGKSFILIDVLANDSTGNCSAGAIELSIISPPTKALAEIDTPTQQIKYTLLRGSSGNDSLTYSITCGGIQSTAKVYIFIVDMPVNIISEDAVCYEIMPADVVFGIRRKFSTENAKPATGYCIDGYTSPLVADLNGDGKPEIIALGVTDAWEAYGSVTTARYINIYNGQTGARMYRYDFGASFSQSAGTSYHRPPSPLAVADLNRDGMAEIVYARPDGNLFAYQPVFSGKTITGMNTLWQATIKYRMPITESGDPFHVPHPYIVDLNGDGIPEVIVFNKVYNGQTGALLMAWQGAAATPVVSSYTSTSGLKDNSSTAPTTQANANAVKTVAMTGRRPVTKAGYGDPYLTVPAIWDIDGDGIQEIITGNRIHKIKINSLTDHTQNTYTTIEGPVSITLTENTDGTKTTHYLSDGFTRIADIDGDGYLDIVVVTPCNDASLDTKILVYVWDPRFPLQVKAALTYYSDGANGNYSIPFIGDINGKNDGWDGVAYTKKLPEICILAGATFINRTSVASGENSRTGIKYHSLSDEVLRAGANNTITPTNLTPGWNNNNTTSNARRFNRNYNATSLAGHVIALTYDATATEIEDRLKLSWAMEHLDRSHSTGITLFDFDNNGTKDICYKDETALRVISPAKGNNGAGIDYVSNSETPATPGTSVMFETPNINNHPDAVYGGTGFEFPVIADVNLDGSADIIVTRSANHQVVNATSGYIMVFEYNGPKWAPCPPVWNQTLYNPLQINEDLTVPLIPQNLLTPFRDGWGNTITPYNGAWIQQPIVKYGEDYVPVVRKPDAVLRNMEVKVLNTTSTKVTLTIRNIGEATIASSAPIAFYNGGPTGKSLETSTPIEVQEVGVDIFKNEMETLDYTITGNFNNCLIWARIMDDHISFPSLGEDDCDTTNNALSGIDCPYLLVKIDAPNTVICGKEGSRTLSVKGKTGFNGYHYTPVFHWYKNDILIPNAMDSILQVTASGEYYCRVKDSLCLGQTQAVTITIDTNCYRISYKANSPIIVPDIVEETYSHYVIINLPPTFTYISGWFFKGWNTSSDGAGTDYQPGQVINVTKNMTLYAQWQLSNFEIWNWEDLSKVIAKQEAGWNTFIVKQNLGKPNRTDTYGIGDNMSPEQQLTHAGDKRFGWYGYEGFVGAAGNIDTTTAYASVNVSLRNNNAKTGYESTALRSFNPNCGWEQNGGWIPVGNNSHPFKSIFNGQRFTIYGLWINRPLIPGQGLFGTVSTIDSVGNLSLVLDTIGIYGAAPTGGFVANADTAKFVNCSVTGTVMSATGAGGFVGISRLTTFLNCYSAGKVKSVAEQLGNYGGFAGSVTGKSTLFSRAYSISAVDGGEYSGGFVGFDGGNVSVYEDCYAAGAVKGTRLSGGFIGDMGASPVMFSYCYFDKWTTGKNDAVGQQGATTPITALTTRQMTELNSIDFIFPAVDVTERSNLTTLSDRKPWAIIDKVTYPYFYWQDKSVSFSRNYNIDTIYENRRALDITKPLKIYSDFEICDHVTTKTVQTKARDAFQTIYPNSNNAEKEVVVYYPMPQYIVIWGISKDHIVKPHVIELKGLECATVRGTVFPFTYNPEDPELSKRFPIVAKLYDASFLLQKPKVVLAAQPLYLDTAIFYDGTIFIPNTPKYPGYIGRTDNPGVPIRWTELGDIQRPVNNTPLLEGEKPETSIGLFQLKDIKKGTYLLVLTKSGHVARFAKVEVNQENVKDILVGHRELIMGDLNGDLKIDGEDIRIVLTKLAQYGDQFYDPRFDLDGDLRVSLWEISIIKAYFQFHAKLYDDTKLCFPGD